MSRPCSTTGPQNAQGLRSCRRGNLGRVPHASLKKVYHPLARMRSNNLLLHLSPGRSLAPKRRKTLLRSSDWWQGAGSPGLVASACALPMSAHPVSRMPTGSLQTCKPSKRPFQPHEACRRKRNPTGNQWQCRAAAETGKVPQQPHRRTVLAAAASVLAALNTSAPASATVEGYTPMNALKVRTELCGGAHFACAHSCSDVPAPSHLRLAGEGLWKGAHEVCGLRSACSLLLEHESELHKLSVAHLAVTAMPTMCARPLGCSIQTW